MSAIKRVLDGADDQGPNKSLKPNDHQPPPATEIPENGSDSAILSSMSLNSPFNAAFKTILDFEIQLNPFQIQNGAPTDLMIVSWSVYRTPRLHETFLAFVIICSESIWAQSKDIFISWMEIHAARGNGDLGYIARVLRRAPEKQTRGNQAQGQEVGGDGGHQEDVEMGEDDSAGGTAQANGKGSMADVMRTEGMRRGGLPDVGGFRETEGAAQYGLQGWETEHRF